MSPKNDMRFCQIHYGGNCKCCADDVQWQRFFQSHKLHILLKHKRCREVFMVDGGRTKNFKKTEVIEGLRWFG